MSSRHGRGRDVNTVHPETVADWREWLAGNHLSRKEIWLVIPRKGSGIPGVRYAEAIEQALCFGWIDSQARKRDSRSTLLRFTPRDPHSTWSRVNRERATRMIERGLMAEPGAVMIESAKAKGTWQVVPDEASAGVPDDLREALEADEAARRNFRAFPPSSRRLILEWIARAKKPETRRRRIERTVALAAVNVRANHPGVRMSDRKTV
ncbi:hypothetical protein DI005_11900 [Prauserella sp. PE36]|nr:hypothetical protein DI005_11900 [Prauserella sp. PE36]